MPKRAEHTGVVTANDDPDKRGRVSVECPTIVAGDVLEWVEPEFHYVDSAKSGGAFFVPSVGSQVTVSIEDEEDSEVMGLEPRWRCTIYPIGKVPEVFETNYPERRGWVTGAGHILYFDDTNDQRTFYYKHPSGTEITVDNSGNINLKPTSGQSVNIGGASFESMVKGDTLKTLLDNFITWANGHSHASHGAAPTVTFGGTTTGILSGSHKVGD